MEKSAELNKFGLSASPRFDSGRDPVNLNLRPSSKGSKLLFSVIKAIKIKSCGLGSKTEKGQLVKVSAQVSYRLKKSQS